MPTDAVLRVRRAIAADADALTALTQASRAYDGPYRAILDGYAVTPAQISRDELHVAIGDDERVVGYYSLVVDGAGEAELDLLFVDDTAQGRGIGALLFSHMRQCALACGTRRVRIISHPPSENFYLRMGARRVGEQPPSGRVTWTRPVLELAV